MQLDWGGVPTRVFRRGNAGNGDTFILPAESGRYNGKLILQAVGTPAGGTITALAVSIDVALDGQAADPPSPTFQEFAAAINLQTGPKQIEVGGLGAGALLRIRTTTFTLGTATGVDIYALAG